VWIQKSRNPFMLPITPNIQKDGSSHPHDSLPGVAKHDATVPRQISQSICTRQTTFDSATLANTSKLPTSKMQDRCTLTGSGAPSSPSVPQTPSGSPPDKTYCSGAMPTQAASGSHSTKSSHSSMGFSSRASPTMAALQGYNMQKQASMPPFISTTDAVYRNSAAPATSATCSMLPQASTVVSQSHHRQFGHLGRTSRTDPMPLDGPTGTGSPSVQSRVDSTSAKESLNSAHEDQDNESMSLPERSVSTEAVHTDKRGYTSASTRDGVTQLNDDEHMRSSKLLLSPYHGIRTN
jgi:hypothetical protein